jgi:hypothetical protein
MVSVTNPYRKLYIFYVSLPFEFPYPARGIALPFYLNAWLQISLLTIRVRVKFTLRLETYRKSVLAPSLLMLVTNVLFFFLHLNPCVHSPCPCRRGWFHMNMLGLCQVFISYIEHDSQSQNYITTDGHLVVCLVVKPYLRSHTRFLLL